MRASGTLRIVIDGRMVSNTGIGRWVENIVSALLKLESQHRITVLVNRDSQRTRAFSAPTRLMRFPAPIYSLREQIYLPLALAAERPDVVHYPNFNVPICDSTPCAVTVHDIIYYLFPKACPSWSAHQYARFMIQHAARKARSIITVSQHSKADLVNHAAVPEEKIKVIYPAIDPAIFRADLSDEESWRVARKYRIERPYIFYTGNHEPRKNLLRMIHAYKMLPMRKDLQLVIGGQIDARRLALYTELSELRERGDAILCGEIKEADLPQMYAAAALFVYPSLYEGFGFPPLEAMAAGTPVACSSAASLPEVVGDAARMFVPTEVEDIAAAMTEILTRPALACDLRRRGLARAQLFSWSKAAADVMQVYEAVAAS